MKNNIFVKRSSVRSGQTILPSTLTVPFYSRGTYRLEITPSVFVNTSPDNVLTNKQIYELYNNIINNSFIKIKVNNIEYGIVKAFNLFMMEKGICDNSPGLSVTIEDVYDTPPIITAEFLLSAPDFSVEDEVVCVYLITVQGILLEVL